MIGFQKSLACIMRGWSYCLICFWKQTFIALNEKRPSNLDGIAFMPGTGLVL